jgi:hypothetical protein
VALNRFARAGCTTACDCKVLINIRNQINLALPLLYIMRAPRGFAGICAK